MCFQIKKKAGNESNPAFGFRSKVQQEAIEIIKDFLMR